MSSIINSFESNSQAANRQPESWTLDHRLLRDVPSPSTQSNNNAPPHVLSFQHLLHLSYVEPDRTYTFVQRPVQSQAPTQQPTATEYTAGPIVQIPKIQTDAHFNMVANSWAQLWTPQRILEVPHGTIYKVRDFTIYIGELHAKRQANVNSPGVVICITTPCGAGDDVDSIPNTQEPLGPDDFADLQSELRGLWKHLTNGMDFGKSEIREFKQIAQHFDGKKDLEQEAVVRMWCEALRVRG